MEPDAEDLLTRNEKAVESEEQIALDKAILDAKGKVICNPAAELTAEQIKQQALLALDTEYQPQFASLAQALGLATLDGDQTVIDGIKTDYATLKSDYQVKKEAIENGK